MKKIIESEYKIEAAPEEVNEILSSLELDPKTKADVMISMLGIFHNNIIAWTTRAFQAVTWAVGINFAVASYTFINSNDIKISASIVITIGLVMFGVMMQLYLRTASRAHNGNRLGIAKCEAALGLYSDGIYIKERSFFRFSKKMFRSKNLEVVTAFHGIATIASIAFVLFGGAFL